MKLSISNIGWDASQDEKVYKLMKKYGIVVSMDATIGKNLSLQHVEVGGTILTGTIGENCIIYHQVTIGNKNKQYPIIGNNVTIYAGAKIIGGICVGDNVVRRYIRGAS